MEQPSGIPQQPTPRSTSSLPEKSSAGPVIGAIIVIVILALGALYFWGAQLNQKPDALPFIPDDNTGESWLPPTSHSDETAAIQSDLDATNMAEFEAQMRSDMEAIETSL